VEDLAGKHPTIEHGTSRPGRWLHARRTRIALTIAAVEGIIVAVFHDVSRWTVLGLAVLALVVWIFAGRNLRSDLGRQTLWIFAASQLLAVIAAILAWILFWTAIIAVVVFGLVALFFVFADRS
jgi:hypothetical protein